MSSRLDLTRSQILAFRRQRRRARRAAPARLATRSGERRGRACRTACRAPRCSRSTRVSRGRDPSTWEDPSLVQVWGPRFSTYVVPARDHAVFTLGRLPDDAPGRQRAEDVAARLHAFLDGRRSDVRRGRDARWGSTRIAAVRRADGHGPASAGTARDSRRSGPCRGLRSTRATPASSSRAGTCTSSVRRRPARSRRGRASAPAEAARGVRLRWSDR